MDLKSVSLAQLVFQVKQQIDSTFNAPIWITAEISELNVNYSGHCYMELVEKEEATDKLLAKSRATIWASVFRMVKPYFETTTRESLKAGLKVLIKVTVEFHEFYGFSLNVIDIDPSYTVGDLVLKRNLIIEKLTKDGVIDMNKGMDIPIVPQRIAIITSETAAGYGDFIKQLTDNSAGIKFHTQLYSAVMQGDNAAESIVNAFNLIFDNIDDFDVVVLIRGGGSKIDLSCFDNYELAYMITQSPLPVITGIGHERDESIADLVANLALKTPTAVAEFLIETIGDYWERINDSYSQIIDRVQDYLDDQSYYLKELSSRFDYEVRSSFEGQLVLLNNYEKVLNSSVNHIFREQNRQLSASANAISVLAKSTVLQSKSLCELRQKRLGKWLKHYVQNQQSELQHLSAKIELVDPQRVLNRGYAIVSKNGKAAKDTSSIKPGDEISISLAKGGLISEVKKVNK